MRIESKIRTRPDVAVFARNHSPYLKAAALRNKNRPEQFTTFRASSKWTAALHANQAHGAIRIYFAVIGAGTNVEYEALIHRIKLNPRKGERETEDLLRFELEETKGEGLWENHTKKVNTLYVITHCRRLASPFPMMWLIKVSDDEPISQDYGYSYSLVYENRPGSQNGMVFSPEEIDPTTDIYEGAARQVLVNAYERSPKARKKCIAHYGYGCSVCGFNFEKKYGPIGRSFIHVHHLKPLAEIDGRYKVDPVKDLRPICPNCHSMVHSKKPMFSIDQLRQLLRKKT